MKTVAAHTIERSVLAEKVQNDREFLDDLIGMLPERADLLSVYARNAIDYAAGILALELPEDAVAWLRRASRAYALMFVQLSHANASASIQLDDETTLAVAGEGDPSKAPAPRWIEAMWCALACDDPVAQHWLATVDTDKLRPQAVAFNDYVLDYAKFLRSLVQRDGSHAQWLSAAIAHCEPSSPELASTQDWIDQFDYPALSSSYRLLTGDAAKFNEALEDLLRNHRSYWSAPSNRLGVRGLLSLPACALRRLADAAELDVQLQSTYMPQAVWQAPAPQQVMTCPYCIGPKPADVELCALCGRDTSNDAPMEVSTAKFRAQQTKECRSCGLRLHTLANTCPRCRQRQS